MSPTLDEQIEQLQHTIAEMESQRDSLGDDVVEASLAPLRQKLDELVHCSNSPKSALQKPPNNSVSWSLYYSWMWLARPARLQAISIPRIR